MQRYTYKVRVFKRSNVSTFGPIVKQANVFKSDHVAILAITGVRIIGANTSLWQIGHRYYGCTPSIFNNIQA